MTSGFNRIDAVAARAPALAGFGTTPVGVRTLSLVNPDQIDLTDPALPRRDRNLTVELWYPAQPGTMQGGSYATLLRDGITPVHLAGRAARDAAAAEGDFPLVILSHGYPGNRMLMAHFGETLASRGYRVASIDHTDSTYADKGAFVSTLVNRPLDTRFVAETLAADRYAIIGYSMGGYGALVAGGAAVSETALAPETYRSQNVTETDANAQSYGRDVLAMHRTPSADPRLKAILPIGPWGRQKDVFDAGGLAGLHVPMLLMAGSADTISGYDTGMRPIFDEAVSVQRHLLTFEGAGHNAAAPYPAPRESFDPSPALDFLPAEHYADPIWDSVQMNGIAQHFAAAFLGLHLKDDPDMKAYLAPGFAGFKPGTAEGLRLETLTP